MPDEFHTYETLGDLDAPFEVSAKDERRQQDRQRLADSMRCDIAPLTYEQYRAGAPCPGCGRPYIDREPFEFRGTMNLSEPERKRYDAEQSRFIATHPSCGAARHGVSGSLTMHCTKCCPMPPLSPSQLARIGTLMTPTPDHELITWRLRLYCGHRIERASHRSHRTVQSAFSGSTNCGECGVDPAIVIDARTIRPDAEPPCQESTRAGRKPSRAALERRLKELEAEVSRLGGSQPLNE
ncbi:MAG: hypothetical protein K0U78_20830 [Actinomycetia bacterium]|nr:hypothetical protein [Actinomycetes bacterium]